MDEVMLALEDMAGRTEDEVKAHIAEEYSGADSGFDYGTPSEQDVADKAEELKAYSILVAYESVGSWGCDSSSWFLLRHDQTGALAVISGSHCSCYGFEGQGDIEETDIAYLKSDQFYLPTGGYDTDEAANVRQVKEFIASLPEATQ